jgi:hypothetical protein
VTVVVREPNAHDSETEASIAQLAPHLVLDRQRELAKTLVGLAVPVSLATGILSSSGIQTRSDILTWSVILLGVGVVLGVASLRSVTMPRATHDLAAVERRFGRAVALNQTLLIVCALSLAASVTASAASVVLEPRTSSVPLLQVESRDAGKYVVTASFELRSSCRGEFPGATIESRSSNTADWMTVWSTSWSDGSTRREKAVTIESAVEAVRLRVCGETVATIKVMVP